MRQLIPTHRDLGGAEELEALYRLPPDPHLRVDFVVSLDGAVEIDGRSGLLGGPADRAAFMAMRSVADVVLVGAGTVRAENYGPVRLDADVQSRRRERGQNPVPPLAIVTRSGDLDPSSPALAAGTRPIVVTSEAVARRLSELPAVADVLGCGSDEVDLLVALETLHSLGLRRVLCEGGPSLFRNLMDIDLVDELCLTISPTLAGPGHLRLSGDEPIGFPTRFRLYGLIEGDGLLLARYARLDPDAGQ